MKVKAYRAMLDEHQHPYMRETAESFNIDGRKAFNDPAEISRFILNEIGLRNAADEHVYIMCLNSKLKLIGLFEASHGGCNNSAFPVREIFQKALLLGAVSIVITHNHPSGDPTPSKADIQSTHRAFEAGEILGVKVLDHVVVAGENYVSFAVNNILCS